MIMIKEDGCSMKISEIVTRRSIRHFIAKEVSDENIKGIIEAGMWAPSEHNEQPWRFIVIRGDERKNLVRALKKGIQKNRSEKDAIFGDGYEKYIPAAIYTARILEQAPVIIFVMNGKGQDYHKPRSAAEYLMELTDIESISAAIQNMCLEATARGIGSLWTCNIFFAYDEIKEWIHSDGEMVAAIAFGYTDREVKPLPRKPLESLIEYRGTCIKEKE